MNHPEPGQRHLVYFADPMCSWCYGFAPVIREIADHFGERLPVELVMGGLRAGNAVPMRDKDRAYIREAWRRVNEATGQPFDLSFFDRESFVYDTEPACRAVVTMRLLNPGLALAYKGKVSSAFYAENRDVTTPEVLSDIAAEMGLDRDKFEEELLSAEARNATFKDFLTAQELGIRGFPTLIAGSRETRQYVLVTNGYRSIDGMIEALESWAAAGHA
jgi:putative protein-disulfide isomerase